ncbi:hypothetical protein AVEN_91831-1 [Araneus ventricosus]|uniref:Uncharacterized protein n=1 Tax=Araneus ventricosus TaxID=182803 RepID=A0A4Y2K374_ARAVE|nr:hypothetical protein AVEN_91831-1 [Araneus ventricosus]
MDSNHSISYSRDTEAIRSPWICGRFFRYFGHLIQLQRCERQGLEPHSMRYSYYLAFIRPGTKKSRQYSSDGLACQWIEYLLICSFESFRRGHTSQVKYGGPFMLELH